MPIVRPLSTAYGKTSWAERTTMYVGGADDWVNRITFPGHGMYSVETLLLSFQKTNTDSYSDTWYFYITTNSAIVGTQLSSCTYLGSHTFSTNNAQQLTMTLDAISGNAATKAAFRVLQTYHSTTWYLLFESNSSTRTTYTGGTGSGGPIGMVWGDTPSVAFYAGGVKKAGVVWKRESGGIWTSSTNMWKREGGVWKTSIIPEV